MTEKEFGSPAGEPISIFTHKEKQVRSETDKATFEFGVAVNALMATHGIEAGQHAVDFLRGYNELIAGLTSLSPDVNVRDVMAGVASNMEHEVEDTLAVYLEPKSDSDH
jgi:hypothetical protein